MDGSRIKLYRKIEERERYKDANTARLFLHCLIKANYEEKQWQGITIKKGSFVTSIDSLCFQLKLTKSCVETALKKLQKSGEIKKQIGSKYTLLELVNRQDYQEDKKQIGNKSETNKKQIGTTKEYKNIRNKEKNTTYSFERKKTVDYWNSISEQIKSRGNPPIPLAPPEPSHSIQEEMSKIKKSGYCEKDVRIAIHSYGKEILSRNKDSDYYHHRFSFYEFIKQKNGFIKFLNKG